MENTKEDLYQCQNELIDLIDGHKQKSGKKETEEQRANSRKQYELWWTELEDVKEHLRRIK